MKKTLFDLSTEMMELADRLESFDGDVSDEQVEAEIDEFLEAMASNVSEFKHKVDSYIYLIAEFDGRADLRLAESRRLHERAMRDKNNAGRLADRLYAVMSRMGMKEMRTDLHDLKIAKVGGKLKVAYTFDNIDDVPDRFKRTEVVVHVDGDRVREALDSGEDLGFATYEERKEKLKIK